MSATHLEDDEPFTRDAHDTRNVVVVVYLTFSGENFEEAVLSVLDLSAVVAELHVVLSMSRSRDVSLSSISGLFEGASSYQKQLVKERILVRLHPGGFFNPKEIFSGAYQLVRMPSINALSVDAWNAQMAHIEHDRQKGLDFSMPRAYNKIYSIRACLDFGQELNQWSGFILALIMFDWWRGVFTQFFRTTNKRDVLIFPVHQCREGMYIPPERRTLGVIPGTGGTGDRARYLHVDDGCTNTFPLSWTGWDQFKWMSKHSDDLGPSSLVFLWMPLIIFVGFPYWRLFLWEGFDMYIVKLRVAIWLLHSSICILITGRYVTMHMQQVLIIFAMPFLYLPLYPVFIYARYFDRPTSAFQANARSRRDKRHTRKND